jgi:hypothetical protein
MKNSTIAGILVMLNIFWWVVGKAIGVEVTTLIGLLYALSLVGMLVVMLKGESE